MENGVRFRGISACARDPRTLRFIGPLLTGLIMILAALPSPADEFEFDFAPPVPRPFEYGGHVELKVEHLHLDRTAPFYRLTYADRDRRRSLQRMTPLLEMDARYRAGMLRLDTRGQASISMDQIETVEQTRLLEGYLSLRPDPTLSIEAGKRTLRWGKGYAWNPVAFMERPKDPGDPDLSREGHVLASATWTRSFMDGPLQTLTFNPVVVPVMDDFNDDFADRNRLYPGGRIYTLLYDTDLDLVFLSEGSRAGRVGLDFAKNITSNFEIHGEWARLFKHASPVLLEDGSIREREQDANRFLLGIRYLTQRETTFIAEYYRDETGYTTDEMETFLDFCRNAANRYDETGDASALREARTLRRDAYGLQNPMRNYLYARVSHREPFDILYFTPAFFTIINLDDHSFQVTPELIYTGYRELELRLRGAFLSGTSHSEFGARPADYRAEMRVRYYF